MTSEYFMSKKGKFIEVSSESRTHAFYSSTDFYKKVEIPFVTVSIPCYKSRGLLRKAVKYVLRQDYPRFELIVVSDADPDDTVSEIQKVQNSKLKIVKLNENVGRYAIDHKVITELSCSDYWVPVDSDDWCAENFLSTLVKLAIKSNPDVVFSAQKVYTNGRSKIYRVKQWDGTGRLQWMAHQAALWKRDFLLEMNLTNPNFRIGWDSIVTSVPWVVGNVEINQNPLYHRVRRINSLTGSKETGFGSDHRNRVKAYLVELWEDIVKNKNNKEEIKNLLLRSRHA
jgi:glycosyltransferase involved in cell wall biosynthesis